MVLFLFVTGLVPAGSVFAPFLTVRQYEHLAPLSTSQHARLELHIRQFDAFSNLNRDVKFLEKLVEILELDVEISERELDRFRRFKKNMTPFILSRGLVKTIPVKILIDRAGKKEIKKIKARESLIAQSLIMGERNGEIRDLLNRSYPELENEEDSAWPVFGAEELLNGLPYSHETRLVLLRSLGIPLVFWMYEEEQGIEKEWSLDPAIPNLDQTLIEAAQSVLLRPGEKKSLNGIGEFVLLPPRVSGAGTPKAVATPSCTHPYLTVRSFAVLKFITALWLEQAQEAGFQTERSQLLINDASRTQAEQNRLLAMPNSTAAPFSSHLTGNTFDLWAKWLKHSSYRQAKIILSILMALQKEEVLNLLDEGHVWHVAVNPRLSESQLNLKLSQVRQKLTGSDGNLAGAFQDNGHVQEAI